MLCFCGVGHTPLWVKERSMASQLSEPTPTPPHWLFLHYPGLISSPQKGHVSWLPAPTQRAACSPVLSRCFCCTVHRLWTGRTTSVRAALTSLSSLAQFSKWMMKSKLSGLAICFFTLTSRNNKVRFQFYFPLRQLWTNDKLLSLSAPYSAFSPDKVLKKHLFNRFHSGATWRAAAGSKPRSWQLGTAPFWPVSLDVCKKRCVQGHIF